MKFRSRHHCGSCGVILDQTCVYIPWPREDAEVLRCIACDGRTRRVDCWVRNHPNWQAEAAKDGVIFA